MICDWIEKTSEKSAMKCDSGMSLKAIQGERNSKKGVRDEMKNYNM